MPLAPVYTNRFKRDVKRLQKQQKDMKKLKKVMTLLAEQKPLAAKYRDHCLIPKKRTRRFFCGREMIKGHRL